jgi:hypothetical protein
LVIDVVAVTGVLIDFSPGLREGSKLMILIFGIHPSVVALSASIAFAERFLVRDGVLDDEGEDEDMTGQISE